LIIISDGGDGIRRIYGIGNESKKLLHKIKTCKRNLIYFICVERWKREKKNLNIN
jgi:hypothetical protein